MNLNLIEDNGVATVYCTNNYSAFKHLQGNRSVEDRRARRIQKSIETVGYVMNPIVVNERKEVIDGQGRLLVLEKLGLPVYYVIAVGAGVEECRQLNIGQSNWRTVDFIESYADEGNPDYVRLMSLINETKGTIFTADTCIGVASNTILHCGRSDKSVKNGEFKFDVKNEKATRDAIDFILDHEKGIKEIPGTTRCIVSAICWVVRNTDIDKKRFGKVLDEKYLLINPVCEEAYIRFLENVSDVYNKGLKNPNKCVYLSEAYKRFLREEV